jgi:hypothetical protein
MKWDVSHNAPREHAVWLYLPCASFKANAQGQATEVTSDCVVAQWDPKRGAWIARDTGHPVYPSMWCDADPAGPKPDNPMISQSGI